ncbi:MAG: DUF6662 family protein [Pseudomonadales bacterium]
MIKRLLLGAVTATALLAQTAQAGENLWVYSKGTDTRPQGSYEFKLSNVTRVGKGSGDYRFNDLRPEIEYGVTDKLTVSGELVFFDHSYSVDNPDLQPFFDTQGEADGRFNQSAFAGYELALKYNVLSPYKDAFGLSLGLSYERRDKYRLDGADINQDSFSGTIYLQKDFLDDTLITVANLKTEFERRKTPGVLEEEISVEFSLGAAYRVAPKWFVGLEFRHQSDYLNPQEKEEAGNPGFDDKGFNNSLDRSSFDLGDFRLGSQHQRGNYFGPSVHYAEKKWWVTAGVLWQVSGGGSQFSFSRNGKNYDEHEKMHVGFSYGYEF